MTSGNERQVVLVTGASGFVGKAMVRSLCTDPRFQVRMASRRDHPESPGGVNAVLSPELGADADWSAVLHGVDGVIHLAARVHMMRDRSANPLAEFRRVNVDGTVRLARQAAEAGVKRFVFLSSIKVNGEETSSRCFSEADPPRPVDPYGVSKYEAEMALAQLASETQMEVVSVRAPLVYGPGVKANFRRMIGWLYRGVPLPFGAIENRRTLIALDNLVDVLRTCLVHPRAANETFLVGDSEDLSTPDLLRRLARALGTRALLIPVPVGVLRVVLAALGLGEEAQRLCSSLQVDSSRVRALLGWHPPLTVDEGIRKVAGDFLANISQPIHHKAA
jgi:nucleoside-diphosphate-sugar epimerase